MERISNADKAFELLNKLDFEDGKFEITDALIEMAEWKDERFKKEKQQLIGNVCEWIKEHNGDYISIVPNDHLTNNFMMTYAN